MGLFRDIMDWKRAQEELEAYRHRICRAERLASAGTLRATVAHELMQPLIAEAVDNLPPITTSEKGMEQVCFALIDNAIQAADGEKDRKLVIKGQVAEGQVALWFEDDCCGMPPEILDQIFQPFFTTKPASESAGLGLCIVEWTVASNVESYPTLIV